MKKAMWRRAVLACAALVLLCSCGPAQKPPTLRIGVSLYQQDDTFISTVVQHLERLVKEEEQARGIKLNLNIADAHGSPAAQSEQMDRFLDQKCDVICMNIVDRTAAAVIVDKAQAADTPVIFFNREPVEEDLDRWDRAYYVGSRAARAGQIQGKIVLNAWKEDPARLDRNGDGVLQYVMLEGEPGHQDTLLRTEHSVKTLVTAGVRTEKLANKNADWQRGRAHVLMQEWLTEFGGDLELVLANNDDMALGAIDACLDVGMTAADLPFIVGVDATPPALEALAAGTLKGTVRNDAEGQAEKMVELICTLLDGKEPSAVLSLENGHYVWLQYSMVTPETLAEAEG